jgi:tetratricopeptide (TPR) repeat protein/CHAT domain-containing protein
MQLLAGVSQGWTQSQVLQHLGNRVNDRFLRAWLREYGRSLRQLPEADHQLAWQLVQLSRVGCGELGEIAAEIGRDLLSKPAGNGGQAVDFGQDANLPAETSAELAPTTPIDNADIDEAEVWLNQGYQQAMAGDLLGAVACYDKALEIQPDYYAAWHDRGVVLNKLERLEEAIASYDKAIEIQPDLHEAWTSRGQALCDLEQLEEAIASWDKVLTIKPDDHEVWYNRGVALAKLGRLEEAIAAYDRVLEVQDNYYPAFINKAFLLFELGRFEQVIPFFDKVLEIQPDYHEAWNYRGKLLTELGQLEQALASYDQALAIQSDYHEAWYERGIVLSELQQYQSAITSYDEALKIKPNSYEVWINRGAVLCDHLQRYEEAIASFDNALKFQPDCHLAWSNRGNALWKLSQFEETIASWDKALHIKPDLHQAWIGRGVAAGRSLNYNPQAAILLQLQFPTSPVVMLNPILTRRGYEGELLTYQEGLKYCHQDTHPEGWGLLHQAIGDAHYFQGKGKPNYQEYWHNTVCEYHQALITLTEEAFPELHLEVVQNLIRVLFGLGKDADAKQWRLHGLEVFRQLLNSKTTSFQRQQLEVKFISFSQMRVDILVEDGDLVLALEAAERNKNLYLTWIFDAQNEHILSPSYRDIQQQLLNPTTAIIYWHLSPFALTTFILKHDATKPLIISSPPFLSRSFSEEVGGDLQHHNQPNEALKRLHDFEKWANDWNKQYQDYCSCEEKADPPQPPFKRGEKELEYSWYDNLPELLKQLHDSLNIPAILSALTDINQLILIPHRDLHRFPLHALFPANFTITYLPSAQIGITLSNSPLTKEGWGGNFLSVEHPDSKGFELLPHAQIESAAIAQLFNIPNESRFSGQAATKTAIKDALTKGYKTCHFTGHAAYNVQYPKHSALFLSGEDKLTLEDICSINLRGYQLVTLAACETAVTGKQTIDNEYVGLVSAFLYQRVTSVISTLWTVPDLASSLFMIYFYWQLKKGKLPTVALAKATKWLRNLTDRKLERLYKIILPHLPETQTVLRSFLEEELNYRLPTINLSQKKQKRFNHPYYWGAFIITGGNQY